MSLSRGEDNGSSNPTNRDGRRVRSAIAYLAAGALRPGYRASRSRARRAYPLELSRHARTPPHPNVPHQPYVRPGPGPVSSDRTAFRGCCTLPSCAHSGSFDPGILAIPAFGPAAAAPLRRARLPIARQPEFRGTVGFLPLRRGQLTLPAVVHAHAVPGFLLSRRQSARSASGVRTYSGGTRRLRSNLCLWRRLPGALAVGGHVVGRPAVGGLFDTLCLLHGDLLHASA